MPDSIGTDTTKKKSTAASQESEIKRTQSALKAAEGKVVTESKDAKPFKKASGIPKAKPHKVAEEKPPKKKETAEAGKKNESSLAPSKKAQRAKGSLAISRAEYGAQKARSLSMTEKLGHKGGTGEKQKDPERVSRGKLRTLKTESDKSALNIKKKSTAEVLQSETESDSEGPTKKKSLTREKMDEEPPISSEEAPTETEKDKEISPSNVPSYPYSTCSLFEKIQHGVKAYFSSRNSLGAKSSMEDKKEPKVTEGGNRIDGGVTKEVEEEREANVLEYENRSRIIVNESSKVSERVLPKRSRLFTGGQSIRFFDARLRTKRQFRMTKCKKLYHSKKNYVRIQIPRKGYFYRSYANLKVPGSSSCLPSRVEPPSFYHTERSSEVQVSGMAAASSQISCFYEKELSDDEEVMSEEKMSKDENDESEEDVLNEFENARSESESYEQCEFSENLKEIKVSKEFNGLPKFDNLKYLGALTNQELNSREKGKTINDEGDVSFKSKREEAAGEESALSQYLGKCIHGGDFEIFLMDQLNGNEEKRAKKTKDPKLSKCSLLLPLEPNDSWNISANVPEVTVKTKCQGAKTNSILSTPVYFESENVKTPFPDMAKPPNNLDSEEIIKNLNKYISSFFMEDIDLHLEFENYLKAAHDNDGNTQTAKARTRNTLQKNHTNWSWENEIFPGETLYDGKISNFQSNILADTNNLTPDLRILEDPISTRGTTQSNPRISSESFDTNLIDKQATAQSSGEYGVGAVYNCLNRMNTFPSTQNQEKSNENFYLFSTEENLESDFKVADTNMTHCDKLKIAKSEYNSRQINNENGTSNTSIKRSFGKTTFQSINTRSESGTDPTMCPKNFPVSQILLTLSNHTAVARSDDYERIFPLTKWPIHSLRMNNYKGINSNVLFKNVEYSLSSESFRLGSTISPLDYSKSYFKGLSLGRDDAMNAREINEQNFNLTVCGSYMEKNTGTDDEMYKNLSLQDVTDIYNSVLDENDKITSDSCNSDSNPIYSRVKALLKEKKLKSNLSKLCDINSKIIEPYVTQGRKQSPGPPDNPETLAKYVNMFQAVLLSSLSINQISNLNSIISGASIPSPENANVEEKKENKVEENTSSTPANNKNKIDKKDKIDKPKNTVNPKESILAKQKTHLLAKRNCLGKIETIGGIRKEKKLMPKNPEPRIKKKTFSECSSVAQKKTTSINRPLNQPKNQKKLKEPIKKADEKQKKQGGEKTTVTNIELSSPRELDSILKTHIKSDATKEAPAKKNLKPSKAAPRKLLVTVNLSGDKILVNSVTRIKSNIPVDCATSPELSEDISDLIIEGLHYKQNKSVPALLRGQKLQIVNGNAKVKEQLSSKKTSSQVIVQGKNRPPPPSKKKQKVSDTPKKPSKAPMIAFKLSDSSIPDDPLGDVIYITSNNTKKVSKKKISKKVNSIEKKEECKRDNERGSKVFQTFEYNQKLLKTQHPLEAIVEKSESKLTESVKKSEPKLTERDTEPKLVEKSPTLPDSDREEVPGDHEFKATKKSYKKLEKVDEILRQLFLNNPLFPKLLQSRLSTLFWDLKNSKSAEIEETKFERKAKSPGGVKANGSDLKEKSLKLPKISKSVNEVLAKNDPKRSMKDVSQPVEKYLKNESSEAPFQSICDSYCYIVNNLVENKKIKTKKKLKITKNIPTELSLQTPEEAKEKEPSDENKIQRSNLNTKHCDKEPNQAFISETAVTKISEVEEAKKKIVKKTKNMNTLEEEKVEKIKKTTSVKIPKRKVSNNTILYVNTEISTDCCSVNVLYNDLGENSLRIDSNIPKKITEDNSKNDLISVENPNTENGASNDIKAVKNNENKKRKRKIKPIKSEVDIQSEAVTQSTESTAGTKKLVAAKNLIASSEEAVVKRRKESPVIIHSSKIEHDDASFPSLMIQSESGLENQPALPATKSQVKNWFKSNSDRKFFPGRVLDNSDEQTPFVTFFLTPRQNENSGLAADQTMIVTRERVPDNHKSKEPKTKKAQEIDGQISLENVEKFIEYLSKTRSKSFRSRESGKKNKGHKGDFKKLSEAAKRAQQMKSCRRFLKSIMPAKNKFYPQLEIKKTLLKTKAEMEKERKLLKRSVIEESKKLELPKREQRVGKPTTPSKAVMQTKSVEGDNQNKTLQGEKKTTLVEGKSNNKLKTEDRLNFIRSPSQNKEIEAQKMSINLKSSDNSVVPRSSSQEHKPKSEKNYALKKPTRKSLTRSCELLDFVKEVISTAPDTKTKKEVIEVIEDYSKTLQKSLIAKSESSKRKVSSAGNESHPQKALFKAASLASVEKSITTKKPGTLISDQKSGGKDKSCKTFTIKIHCNSHGGVANQAVNCTKEIEKSLRKKTAQSSLDTSPLLASNSTKIGNMNLLDSLVTKSIKKSSSNELSRVSSTYFDAAENFTDFSDSLIAAQSETSDSETPEPVISVNNYPQEQNGFTPAITYNWVEKTETNKMNAVSLKPSDIVLFSHEVLTNECEEVIFNKIMKYLQTDDVNYAMTLVEELLKKSNNCEKKLHNSSKMKNLLKGIESKSKTLIEDMEKGGWLQVLSLIEEVASVFYMEKKSLDMFKQETKLSEKIFKAQYLMPEVIESLKSLEKQVHRSRIFLNAVKSISETGLLVSDISHQERPSFVEEMVRCDQISNAEVTATLAKNANFLEKENMSKSNSYIGSIFSSFGKSYRDLKQNISTKGGSEEEFNVDEINVDSKQELQIHKTTNAIKIPGGLSVCHLNRENESTLFLNQLKEQTRLQRQYIHYLLSSAYDPVHPDVQAIRNKVADRLESLENAIVQLEASYCTKLESYSCADTIRTTSGEQAGKSSYSSLVQTHSISLNASKINESEELFDCRSEKNNDLNSLNYLVFEGLRSFNKSYSTSFDVGPCISEEPQLQNKKLQIHDAS